MQHNDHLGSEDFDADHFCNRIIITGSGLGAAIPFALEIIRYLEGPDVAEMKRKAIVYRH